MKVTIYLSFNDWFIKIYNPNTNLFVDKKITTNSVSALLQGIDCNVTEQEYGYTFEIN